MDLENIMSIMSKLENNKSPKNMFISCKNNTSRKYGLRKYYKLFENNKVRKFVLYNL